MWFPGRDWPHMLQEPTGIRKIRPGMDITTYQLQQGNSMYNSGNIGMKEKIWRHRPEACKECVYCEIDYVRVIVQGWNPNWHLSLLITVCVVSVQRKKSDMIIRRNDTSRCVPTMQKYCYWGYKDRLPAISIRNIFNYDSNIPELHTRQQWPILFGDRPSRHYQNPKSRFGRRHLYFQTDILAWWRRLCEQACINSNEVDRSWGWTRVEGWQKPASVLFGAMQWRLM